MQTLRHGQDCRLRHVTRAALAALALAAALLPSAVLAAPVVTGDIQTESQAPSSVEPFVLTDTSVVRLFREQERFTLPVDVAVDFVDPGTYSNGTSFPSPRPRILAGTVVDSFFVHANPDDERSHVFAGTITFDSEVLGVIVRGSTFVLLEDGTDAPVGAPGTSYPKRPIEGSGFRGLELNANEFVVLDAARRTLTFRLQTGDVDQVRVITAAVPLPEPPSGPVVAPSCEGGRNAEDLVRCLYERLLGRTGAEFEQDAWAAIRALGPDFATPGYLTHGFTDSIEHMGHRLTPALQIQLLYRVLLDRDPDAAGLAAWTNFLIRRHETMLFFIANSPEFRTRASQDNASDILRRLYREALGRTPSFEELAACVILLRTTSNPSGLDWGALSAVILSSSEYLSTPRTLGEHVAIVYRAMLGREPEPDGIAFWVYYLLRQYGMVVDSFVASPEFSARMAGWK